MPPQLRVSTDQHGRWTVVRAEGEIDIASVEMLESSVSRIREGGVKCLLFDLEPVTFMDSTGLRVLVSSHQEMKSEGGEIALVVGNGPVRRLLQVSGLEEGLAVYTSFDEVEES